ncbi:galactose-specific lectin nattectin-like [Corythoichthys intestinalis]|uniref:galactose-specific lectin nattectin-like n=1 Tax=Corythoichthys intestinalis TaxID=161448 RepID=UPI0025A5980A|nr:galactose-specific lectin nattectin-like [Corythoichthys intestinalis]XP_061802907.1 galactose-specific lectin nattectin-like [Nerophis lumbriciformis]
MAFALGSLFLFCSISSLLTGVYSRTNLHENGNSCCPKGWTRLDHRCFIYQDDRREFADAEKVCQVIGGNLASIHSTLEYTVVLEMIKEASDSSDDVWIGLHESIEEKAFFWTDGSSVDFTTFNDNVTSGDCVEIEFQDGQWDNDSCYDRNRFVCARDIEQCCQ